MSPGLRIIHAFLVFLISANVSAATRSSSLDSDGFLFEPALSYSTGVLSQTGVPDIVTTIYNFEVRLGYRFGAWALGTSYQIGQGTGVQMGAKGDVKPTDLGLFAAYDLPMDFSVFAGVLFTSNLKIQSSENPEDFSGQGTRLGLAWKGWSYGSLGIEVVSRKYQKYGASELTNSIGDSSTNFLISYPLL